MHILAEISPLDPVTGSRVTIRLSSAEVADVNGKGGLRWWPGITRKPALGIRLFEGNFETKIAAANATMTVQLAAMQKQYANAARLVWAAAPITLYSGQASSSWPWRTAFAGRVLGFRGEKQSIEITAIVDTEPFEGDALAAYAGTGGIEGGEDLKGKIKPLVLGRALNVEPVLINALDNVYQVSAYGAIAAITNLYERGSDFGASVGNYATYAALVSASVPAGTWATCNAQGLIRLGAPAAGLITADVNGDNDGGSHLRRPGSLIRRLCAIAGVSTSLIETASLDAMDAKAATLPSGGYMDDYLTSQIDALSYAEDVARCINYHAGVSLSGKLFVTTPDLSSPSLRLDFLGRHRPPVSGSVEVEVSPPYKQITMGARRCWRVHTLDEIASLDPLPGSSGNLLANSSFRDGLSQWGLRWAGPTGLTTMTLDSDGRLELNSRAGSFGGDTNYGSFGAFDGGARRSGYYLIKGTPGMAVAWRIAGQVVTANTRCTPYFRMLAADLTTELAGSGWGDNAALGGLFPGYGHFDDDSDEGAGRWIAPASTPDVWWLEVEWYGVAGGAAAVRDVRVSRTMLAIIDPAQTVPPPWSEGPTGEYRATFGATPAQAADLAAASSAIAAIVSDSVLSRGEKPGQIILYNALYENWQALDAKAASLGITGAVVSGASSAVSALSSYLSGLSPLWTNTGADTPIVAATYQTRWDDANAAVAALQAAIQGIPGDDGDPGISPVLGVVLPESVTLQCDSAGNAFSGQFPAVFSISATQAGSAVVVTGISIVSTSRVSASVVGSAVHVTAIDGGTVGGSLVVDISAEGQTSRRTLTVNKQLAQATGVSSAVMIEGATFSTSYDQMGSVISLNASATGKINAFSIADVFLSGTAGASVTATIKIQYKLTSSGTWIDVPSSATSGSGTVPSDFEIYTGVRSLTGLTANASYDFRVHGFRSSGPFSADAAPVQLFVEKVT